MTRNYSLRLLNAEPGGDAVHHLLEIRGPWALQPGTLTS